MIAVAVQPLNEGRTFVEVMLFSVGYTMSPSKQGDGISYSALCVQSNAETDKLGLCSTSGSLLLLLFKRIDALSL